MLYHSALIEEKDLALFIDSSLCIDSSLQDILLAGDLPIDLIHKEKSREVK